MLPAPVTSHPSLFLQTAIEKKGSSPVKTCSALLLSCRGGEGCHQLSHPELPPVLG